VRYAVGMAVVVALLPFTVAATCRRGSTVVLSGVAFPALRLYAMPEREGAGVAVAAEVAPAPRESWRGVRRRGGVCQASCY